MPRPSVVQDFKRLARYAAVAAAVLGWVCHMLPEHWRAPCHALAQLCSLGAGGSP